MQAVGKRTFATIEYQSLERQNLGYSKDIEPLVVLSLNEGDALLRDGSRMYEPR